MKPRPGNFPGESRIIANHLPLIRRPRFASTYSGKFDAPREHLDFHRETFQPKLSPRGSFHSRRYDTRVEWRGVNSTRFPPRLFIPSTPFSLLGPISPLLLRLSRDFWKLPLFARKRKISRRSVNRGERSAGSAKRRKRGISSRASLMNLPEAQRERFSPLHGEAGRD